MKLCSSDNHYATLSLKFLAIATQEHSLVNTDNSDINTVYFGLTPVKKRKKVSQLIECNMISIFPGKSYTKFGGEIVSRHCSKKSKLSISLDSSLKIYAVSFYCMPS